MNAFILHETDRGLFINLPVPVHAVAYAIVETPEEILTLWVMKRPGDESITTYADAAREAYPGFDWTYVPDIESMGYLEGSAHDYESYRLLKDGSKLVLDAEGGGTISAAFGDVSSSTPHRAAAVEDIDSLAAHYGLLVPGAGAELLGQASGLDDRSGD
jgi:hypothetical protein